MRGFLSINYEEGTNSEISYKSIDVSVDSKYKKVFDSGDPIIDYIEYIHWYDDADPDMTGVGYSSSWDHFFMDQNKWKTMYVDHTSDNNKVIVDFSTLSIDGINKLMQYIVTDDIKTFDDLKNYYHTNKKQLTKV